MKSPRYPILMGILWLFAMGSLLITHFWLNGKSKTTRAAPGLDLYIKGLDPDLKIQLGHYEDAALIMEDGRILLIGRDFEQETDRLINANIVDYKKVDIPIGDPLMLERRMMASEAFKKLNNAEKICLADGHGAILYHEGSYVFLVVRTVYEDYAKRYGTACTACGKQN
jgi:hypothetical protein